MRVDQAKKLKYGQLVSCPMDNGQGSYMATVQDENLHQATVYTNFRGSEYVWVQVQGPTGRKTVWPSNRLGFA